MRVSHLAAALLVMAAIGPTEAAAPAIHNVILFVPDGLRAAIVDDKIAPNFAAVRRDGVDFANSHSLFPTFTTANASAFATGHYLGDTGDFSNVIYTGFPVANANGSVTPFLEQDDVIGEMNTHFGGNYLSEVSILAGARAREFATAAIGKLGPVALQDATARDGLATIIIDDITGNRGISVGPEIAAAIMAAGLPASPPPRANDVANVAQQKYFLEVTTKVLLPRFKNAGKPFVLVYWSRDPDGTQHNQDEGNGKLVPGINGPHSLDAISNADSNLRDIRATLDQLGLAATTDVIISADHGFSTVSKESKTSTAARDKNGSLQAGFLAADLAKSLRMKAFDPDKAGAAVDFDHGESPTRGNALIGADKERPDIVVAANGGSDLIYLPQTNARTLAPRIVAALLAQDYVSGIFVDDALGAVPGTLPLSAINLKGTARTPTPALVVNFRSFDTGCGVPIRCGAIIADSNLGQGHGSHGSFSRSDTANFMAAIGPDFKTRYRDEAPVSNADIGATIAHILSLNTPATGSLKGRVLTEALRGGPATISGQKKVLRGAPSQGLATILRYQAVGETLYFDAAGFEGRTLGLSE